jgi:hypothetical protein
VLDEIGRSYTTRMASVAEQMTGRPEELRVEMARYHGAALENACLRALKDRGMSPEPETLSRDYWAITCLRYGLGAADDAPNPWDARPAPTPVSPLTGEQRKAFATAYDEAFDRWMVGRIERGHDSPKDFARADFFAWSTAYDSIANDETVASDEEFAELRADLYEASVDRLGYADRLPRPLPTMDD